MSNEHNNAIISGAIVPGKLDKYERASSNEPPKEPLTRTLPVKNYGPPPDREEDRRVELIEYWRILRRRQGTLVLAICLGLVAALLLTLPQTPVYQAKTSLELLNLNEDFMNMKDIDQVAEQSGYNLITDIQTQIKILQSDTLLDRVYGELKDANSGGASTEVNTSAWLKFLNLPAMRKQNSQDKALKMAQKDLKVRAAGQTRIIELMVDSTDPKIASDFANRLIQDYIEENIESRWEMTQKTGDFLSKQIDDMRAKLERSEDLMQTYARQNGLVFTDEKDNVASERLKDLQDELAKAQGDRVEKQSRWELASTASPETLPDVLNDSTLRQYEEKLADLKREKADLEEAFTPDYSKVKRVAAEIDAVQQSLVAQQVDITRQIKNEYDAAVRREMLLEDDSRKQASVVGDQSEKAIQYNILKREVDTNREIYESMLQHVKEASIAGALKASNIRVVDVAKVPPHPYKPEIWLNSLLGMLAGMFFGVAYIVMTEKADRMLQEPADITLYLGVPELGAIPAGNALKQANGRYFYGAQKNAERANELALSPNLRQLPELVTWQQKPSLMAESFRAALTSVLFAGHNGDRPKTLVVTSPNPGDGKTTVVSNLAIALAETGQRVLLIDGDMRKPRLHTVFDLDNTKGLTTMLRNGYHNGNGGGNGSGNKEHDAGYRETPIPNLFVLTAGPSTSGTTNLLYAKHFPSTLRQYEEEFDMILIDTPPMLTIADARLIGKLADAVLLVVRAGSTTRDAAVAASSRLKEDGIRVIGTIMNDWNPRHSRSGYYGYYDGYYSYYKKPYAYGPSDEEKAGNNEATS
jgi:polysaccharide biosynthesis transport protein